SPTQRVGGQPIEGFATVTHRVPMLSIENTYNAAELREFDNRVRKVLGKEPVCYVVEPKIDGVAVSLTYVDGVLAGGATRGAGAHTRTRARGAARRAPTAPPPPLFEARGEAYMTRADFAKINEGRKKKGEKAYENPRNLTAGSLKLLDPKLCAERRLRLFAYGLGAVEGVQVRTHWKSLELLKDYGFPINPHIATFD